MAAYLMGVQSGKSKESGNNWYKVVLLLQDSYGIWNTKFFFVQPKVFKAVEKYDLSVGYPVIPKFSVNGEKLALTGIKPDLDVAPVELVPDDTDADDD